MPKWSSYLTRFILLLVICILVISVFAFALSSYFFSQATRDAEFALLKNNIQSASRLLRDYTRGEITKEELKGILNPRLNPDGVFYLLMDEGGQVLSYSEEAVPYLAQASSKTLQNAIVDAEGTLIRSGVNGKFAVVVGSKTEDGYIYAGRTTQLTTGTEMSFRMRMMLSLISVLCLILLLSTFFARKVSRPARMITEMAGRLIEGDAVEVPEDMPGQEMREIARAFNHMSAAVARAIRELKYEKENMNLVLEGLSEGVVAVDMEGAFLHVNTAARELLGENTPEFSALMEAMQGEETEGRILKGQQVLLFTISVLPGEAGEEPQGKVALIRDVTKEERLERTRRDYVANISHELRTPLTSIRGLAEGLRDGMVGEEEDRQRYYNIIVNESTRLSRLVNDLLELSSLQSNPAAFETEKVDPGELLWDTHDRNRSLFDKKGITFLCDMPKEELPVIYSNEDRLSQVLTIFLDNARKFTQEGGTVTLGARKEETGILFYVRDSGIGMDEETKKMAFERFHQAEAGRSGKGSGLGLSIAREILKKMGVEIQVESAPGKGSTFRFTVPFGSGEKG
ncbi:MAG: PAS domain-containing protein [Clostridia bacterium]|nr:PAS domain-containing protein [Clostridia bacterium]